MASIHDSFVTANKYAEAMYLEGITKSFNCWVTVIKDMAYLSATVHTFEVDYSLEVLHLIQGNDVIVDHGLLLRARRYQFR